jgi:hypothetical protein
MIIILPVVAVLLFITTLLSCALTEQKIKDAGAELLSQQELVEFFNQERVVTLSTSSGSAKGYYFPDGTQKIEWPGGGDKGSFKIENGLFCSKWNTKRSGQEACYRIYHTDDKEYVWFNLDGSYDSTMIVLK